MTKTFGLRTPTDLYRKLVHDIERLDTAPYSAPLSYAAYDCAVTATHIADWVVHTVGSAQHLRLTGKTTGHNEAMKGFGQTNAKRLPALEFCRQIANAVKHVKVTRGPTMDNMTTGRSVRFDPPIDFTQPIPPDQKMLPHAYITVDDKSYPVINLFRDMAVQWQQFLLEEGLFEEDQDE
ncbi:hypothetical protein F4V91_06840 [Neorhizobium galegae]|uniref:Uncharacterized protein n=1 Tax=Neorhizobium galegae TaxID=399 RepID=A0A6A1TQ62_NEOGA|nr:hypothetical protein [Neorhizobium galegae]KAB1086175.1 hypothetical protein F4V91_06840 [Neorhizobium galegae]